jgi:hypothetical protein
MGIDLRIVVRAKAGYSPPSPERVGGQFCESGYFAGYTHELSSLTRYYGPGYERGPWPDIAATLLELLADENIEDVGYGGDSDEYVEPVTLAWLTQMNLHYIDNADRPYRARAACVRRYVRVVVTEDKDSGEKA